MEQNALFHGFTCVPSTKVDLFIVQNQSRPSIFLNNLASTGGLISVGRLSKYLENPGRKFSSGNSIKISKIIYGKVPPRCL